MPRITSDISNELKDAIQVMADDKKWSFSQTVCVLLQYAVKEKHRKKKNNSQNNTGYVGQSDSQ
jgi:hypothetical protein